MTSRARRALAAAGVARVALQLLSTWSPAASRQTNFRGREVSLLAGPALALSLASSGPAALAAVGSGLVGGYDDAVGNRDGAKGFRGHLTALASGRLTAGGVKLMGIPALGVLAASRLRPRGIADVLLGGAVIAGAANLVNLLDLRPGRALKVGLLAAVALDEPGIAGSCAALLPADLAESHMLGDAGANALGAALGVAAITWLPSRGGRLVVLTGLVGLTAASERVSFSRVIDATPPLHWLDSLGRRT